VTHDVSVGDRTSMIPEYRFASNRTVILPNAFGSVDTIVQ
jgi:hypothetical protein